jgi:DNA-binding PadR family transcriptional regulator
MKVFDDSMLFYWHATHTQIYNTLKEMEKEGLVVGEVIHQVANPSKKIFSITEKGKEAITAWLIEVPVLMDFKHN